MDDLVDELLSQGLVAASQEQCDHDDAIFEAFEVALSVKGLQRVRGVELESTEEGLEPELSRIGVLRKLLDEVEGVLIELRARSIPSRRGSPASP